MTDSRLATLGVEVVGQTDPSRRLATKGVEVIAGGSGITRRLATIAIEVMVPNEIVDPSYSGWGIKL